MTEQSFPFGGTAVAEPPAPELPTSYDEEPDNGNRQKLMAVGAAVVILVVLVAAFMMLKGGSSSPAAFVPVHHVPAATSTGTQPSTSTKPVHLPKSYKGHVGRDPFTALYKAPTAAPAGATSGSTTTPSGSSTAPTTTVTTGSTTGTTTGSTTGTTAAPAAQPVWLQLMHLNAAGTKATFAVAYSDGSKLTVKKYHRVAPSTTNSPTVFAKVFGLLSVGNGGVVVQYGDGTPIEMFPGASNRLVVN